MAAPPVDRRAYRKFDTPLTRSRAAYVSVHFLAVLLVSAGLLHAQTRLPFPALAAGTGFVLLSLVALTALLEGRSWAPTVEAARLAATGVAAAAFLLA